MKQLLFISILVAFITQVSYGQNKIETEIRRLEQLEIEAIHKADTVTLAKLWSKDFVVNNPANRIVTRSQVLAFIRQGEIDYSSEERIVEKITLSGNLAISMGKEIVTPQNLTDNAGKKVTRRYTDIWVETKGVWQLTARQATIISVE